MVDDEHKNLKKGKALGCKAILAEPTGAFLADVRDQSAQCYAARREADKVIGTSQLGVFSHPSLGAGVSPAEASTKVVETGAGAESPNNLDNVNRPDR